MEVLSEEQGKINGLDLFSGIAGISLALEPWVRTVAYCEQDLYAQAVLLSRMAEGKLDVAPIWDDVKTLCWSMLPPIDIIFAGFPCTDISVAGAQKGIQAERSGLFFEIMRLAEEIRPTFIFLENVPAIRTNGLGMVIRELASLRYDCRWGMLSAYDVGAPHKRERWFLLANRNWQGSQKQLLPEQQRTSKGKLGVKGDGFMADSMCAGLHFTKNGSGFGTSNDRSQTGEDRSAIAQGRPEAAWTQESSTKMFGVGCTNVSDSNRKGMAKQQRTIERQSIRESRRGGLPNMANSNFEGLQRRCECGECTSEWTSWPCGGTFPDAWRSDAGILRVAHGVSKRVDRIKCCGNSVVPIQAREAFKRLMGLL